MTPCLISCFVTMLPVLFPQLHAELVKREKSNLQGTWVFHSAIQNGSSTGASWPRGDKRIPTWVFSGDFVTWDLTLIDGTSAYGIDLTRTPKQLDLIPDHPDTDRGSPFQAKPIYSKLIYSLDGDELKIAWNSQVEWRIPSHTFLENDGGAMFEQIRAKDFRGQSGSGDIVWVLKRVKK